MEWARRARIAAAIFAVGIVFALLAHQGRSPARADAPTRAIDAEARSTSRALPPIPALPSTVTPRPGGSVQLPADVLEAIENGSKEPLVPREIVVEARPVPGSTVTLDPLTPREIEVTAEPLPGEKMTNEPLVPRAMDALDASAR